MVTKFIATSIRPDGTVMQSAPHPSREAAQADLIAKKIKAGVPPHEAEKTENDLMDIKL